MSSSIRSRPPSPLRPCRSMRHLLLLACPLIWTLLAHVRGVLHVVALADNGASVGMLPRRQQQQQGIYHGGAFDDSSDPHNDGVEGGPTDVPSAGVTDRLAEYLPWISRLGGQRGLKDKVTEGAKEKKEKGADAPKEQASGPDPRAAQVPDYSGLPTLFEAEYFTSQAGCIQEDDHGGYTGEGYMDFGLSGSYIEWDKVTVPHTGEYELVIRYAVGDTSGRASILYLEEEQQASLPLPFDYTGSWGDWSFQSALVFLVVGANKVRVQSVANGPNIDHMQVIYQDQVIKTPLVSNTKNGTEFEELHPTGGIKKIYASTGHEINGLQLVYRPNVEGDYHGRHTPNKVHVLDDDEEIVRIVCKEHIDTYGMEYIYFFTDKGNSINITTNGSNGGNGTVAEFVAPDGYILAGFHGLLGGTYENSLITIGFYWIVKPTPVPSSSPTTSSPTRSPSPSAMPSVSGMPSTSSMPTFIEFVDSTTLDRKIMAGYQGWFLTPGDGSGRGWHHWSDGEPNPGSVTVDMWPDLREYDADELAPTNFSYSDGSNAGLFSSRNPKTVYRHVKWMHEYGIDGVFVQRFVSEAVNVNFTESRDQVLDNVRKGSEAFGRVFANMYDLSTVPSLKEQLINDWKHLVDDLNITSSPRYLHHKGRPVLGMWGFDVSSRNHNVTEAHEIIDWFTRDADDKYLVTLMGGAMTRWREIEKWQDVYARFDVISPWAVGRYSTLPGADSFRDNFIVPDLNYTNATGIDYLPVVFPGFSWYNLKNGALNQIPRLGGNFLWRQLHNAMNAGANMIYVAMFDEVDEATAIFKTAENAHQTPTTGTFLTLDEDGEAVPSDWYLYLVGEARRLLRAGLVDENLPTRV